MLGHPFLSFFSCPLLLSTLTSLLFTAASVVQLKLDVERKSAAAEERAGKVRLLFDSAGPLLLSAGVISPPCCVFVSSLELMLLLLLLPTLNACPEWIPGEELVVVAVRRRVLLVFPC